MRRFGMLAVVARQLRIQYPGAVYPVMNRDDRRDPIFHGELDYELFLRTLEEACRKALWQVHAHCLMRNPLGERETQGNGMDGAGFGRPAQGRCGEGETGGVLAGGDDPAAGVDCGAFADGQSPLSDVAAATARPSGIN